MDSDDFDTDLFDAITGEEEKETKEKAKTIEELIPQKIIMADRCLQVGKMIGPSAKKIIKDRYEVGGFFMFNKGDQTFTFRDFIIPQDMEVGYGHIRIDENYDTAVRENNELNTKRDMPLYLGAMFHVHPGMTKSSLYHSPADDESLKNLVNKMAKSTRTIHESFFPLIEDKLQVEYGIDYFCLKGDMLTDAIQRFYYPDDELFFKVIREFGLNPNPHDFKKDEFLGKLLQMIDAKTYEPRTVNVAFSFVFNNAGDMPYVKMGVEESFKFSKKTTYGTMEDLPIEIIEQGVDIPTKNLITGLINERVKFINYKKFEPHIGSDADFTGVISKGYDKWGGSTGYYGATTVPKFDSVQERIDSIIDKLEKEENHKGIKILPTRKPKANSVEKASDNMYTLGEIINLFIFSANQYVATHRHAESKYSTYMACLLDKLGEYVPSTRTAGYTSYTTNSTTLKGVNSAIISLGYLVEDNQKIVEKHNIPFYKMRDMYDNILNEVSAFKEERQSTLRFMLDFGLAPNTLIRNELLEAYVTGLVDSQAKPNDPKDITDILNLS